jgi:GNAT superfamily N-acetyltransferase
VITMSAPAQDTGISVLAAGARAAMAACGGDGEGVGLAVRLLAVDARNRLRGGEENITLTVLAEVRGTEFMVTLHDLGEPVTGAPDGVLSLLEFGVATSAEARTDGSGNVTEVRFALPGHNRILDVQQVAEVPEDAEPLADEVEYRAMRPEDAASLTRTLFRCYGWSYPNAGFYYPERITAALEAGERIGEVAVTADGEVVSHWGAVYLSPNVVETGGTVTDPRFRRRGIAGVLGARLLQRLEDLGAGGRLREPVLTHPATQEIALREGATMIGAFINVTNPIQQVGITDGIQSGRASLSVAFSALRPLSAATIWIPTLYEPFVRTILESSGWPRELAPPQADAKHPNLSTFSTVFSADNSFGLLDVASVGRDLLDVIDRSLRQMRRSGAVHVQVRLPANQPALGTLAAGLGELELGFAAFIPEFRLPVELDGGGLDRGDVLVTQWLAEPDVDTSSWIYASEAVSAFMLSVARQAREVGSRGQTQQLRAARRAQLFAALD